jgi:hypothetical protein
MLSHNTPSKPRPIPPAKLRRARAPSLPIQPPPPYAPADTILNSPITMTAQLVGSRSPDAMQGGQNLSAAVEDWMTEKSREELSNLLVAAGDLIKSRETGTYRSVLFLTLHRWSLAGLHVLTLLYHCTPN